MLPWLLCIGLGLLALYLGGKVYGLRRTMEDIGDRLETWLDEDSKPKPGKNYDYTETYEEGECL